MEGLVSMGYTSNYMRWLLHNIYFYVCVSCCVCVCLQALDHITAGMEDILGHVGHNRVRVSELYVVLTTFFDTFTGGGWQAFS